jgi:hypothetical protein
MMAEEGGDEQRREVVAEGAVLASMRELSAWGSS